MEIVDSLNRLSSYIENNKDSKIEMTLDYY